MPADFLHPFVLGTPEQFCKLRDLLLRADYTAHAICERTGIETIFDFDIASGETLSQTPPGDLLDLLLRLLMYGHLAAEKDLFTFLGDGELPLFEALGVLARLEDDPSLWYSTACLYPVENVYMASDRPSLPTPTSQGELPRDLVFSAISRHTRKFLEAIPRDPCENFLDLCAGGGIAALLAGANFAKHACAADLGPRCVHFAEFCRRLNGLENVSTAVGDLYRAVEGQKFDRIVAHPPFIPSTGTSLLFRDGGEDGEQIFRGVIQGAAGALAAGGRLHCVTSASDRRTGLLEDRVREMLGAEQEDFDVFIVASELYPRAEAAADALLQSQRRHASPEKQDWTDRLGVTALFYGSVIVQRKPENRHAVTARTRKAPGVVGPVGELYRAFLTALSSPETRTNFAELRPSLAPGFRLDIRHKPGTADHVLVPESFTLHLEYPWLSEASGEAWMVMLFRLCDGKRNISELHNTMQEQGVISRETSLSQLWEIVMLLTAAGFFQLDFQVV